MCWTERNALYKGISVVGADYDKIKEIIKKIFTKMDTKSDPEIDAWTIRGSTFQVLGGIFWGVWFLMNF